MIAAGSWSPFWTRRVAVSTSNTSSTSARTASEAGRTTWPVLARLPEIEEHNTARSLATDGPRKARSSEYRFDPPQLRPYHTAGWRENERKSSSVSSPILPSSDPFAIPSSSLHEAVAPVIRFLILVALFTMAGTMILMMGKEKSTDAKPAEPLTANVEQSLEPAGIVTQTPIVAEPAVSISKATGPTASTSGLSDQTVSDAWPADSELERSGKSDKDSLERHAASDDLEFPPWPEATSANFPPTALPQSHTASLPKVQTAEPPISVAHLPGHLELPSGQANHDDDEPSLH
jgi:hypothetical protein